MSGPTIVALGDIHSNAPALRACVERIDQIRPDMVIFMGDYISDCACPQETLALMKHCAETHDCRFILGNREQYMLDHRAGRTNWTRGTGGGSLIYTYARLTETDLDTFEHMPALIRIPFEGYESLLCCHGAPDDLRGWLADMPDQAQAWLDRHDCGLVLCAHTHRPGVMPLKRGTLVNTGTVGLPIDRPGQAAMVLLQGRSGSWHAEIVRVPFDPEETIARFERDGLYDEAREWPRMIARQLRFGGEPAIQMIRYAHELSPDGPIAESVWHEAAQMVLKGTE